MSEVPRVRTPISIESAATELLAALRAAGEEPFQQEAQLLLAQLWLETNRGFDCDNRNVGNITAGPRWTGDFFRPAWFTVDDSSSAILKQRHDEMQKGTAPSSFRSYDSFEHGFADYVGQLLHTFPSIVEAARGADPNDVARAIRRSGYSPDPKDPNGSSFAPSLAALRREFVTRGVFVDLPLAEAAAAAPPSQS